MDKIFHTQKLTEISDEELIKRSLSGDGDSLENLVKKHQPFVYNIAWKMVLNPDDAADITQEVLIKVITHLSQFRFKSSFQTWLYRIAFNHFLKMKKGKMEQAVSSFETYGEGLDAIPNEDLTVAEQMEMNEHVEDVKIGCMAGMLLCLARKERLVYILGEIFNIDSISASTVLEISPENFRKQLSRARKNMLNFMHNKCGLINNNNPCRCTKKTKGFIRAGWVNTKDFQFNIKHKQKIYQLSAEKDRRLCKSLEDEYAALFSEHPFKEDVPSLTKSILDDPNIREVFDLN